ncbi:hypothetical protein AYL99_06245 [Fonsecaea erecta]|uniref:Uncharacterized protein n=1 Tax=Fonsecaea erecta TaxID=1367422 RepID=A0A178ZGP1_9EURO|nr:hypothetical protein AYL99_06245 [Fonsecaea erecta]OAP58948.1 hypothetical protein AYL99_06245 [Fonsecaea erecta]
MCKIIRFRYTKCYRPSDAGDDYDEHTPENLCDGGVEELKLPCFVEVCDKHKDGVPQYTFPFTGWANESSKCEPSVKICYLPTYCAAHREAMSRNDLPMPVDDNIHTEPELPLEEFVWHIPRVQWKDLSFRMVDWNPEPRKVPLDHPSSPKTQSTFNPEDGGVINAFYDAEHWISADGRPIDLLENHYDDADINDRPAGPRTRRPAMPSLESKPPQGDQNPGSQSTQPGVQPTNSQESSQAHVSQGQPSYNRFQESQSSIKTTHPAAPLSGNPFGTWREASKSRLSALDSSASDGSSSSSPSGRGTMAQTFMNHLKKRKRGYQPRGSSRTKPSSVPATQTSVQSAARLRRLLLERVPRLDTDIPGGLSDVSYTGQHRDPEQTAVEMSPDEVNQAWETLIKVYQNGERDFSPFSYPRQPVLRIRLLLRSGPRDSTSPTISTPVGPESIRRSVASQSPSPDQDAAPQGHEVPDDDNEDEEEQKPPKRLKLIMRAATPVAKIHHMNLRSRAPKPAPTTTPTPASMQPNGPVARTVARGRAGTAARAGTRAKFTKTTNKGKSAATTKNKVRQGTRIQKKKKKTTPPAPGPGPMTRARRRAQGAQLHAGLP